MTKVAEKTESKYKVGERIDVTAGVEITAMPEAEVLVAHGASDEDKNLLKDIAEKAAHEVKKGLEYGDIEVVVSNSGIDRYGDSITMEGIDLTQIRRNPVVLWAHQYSGLPIGRIIKLWRSNGNLMARIHLDYDLYDFADTVYKMILRGTINAVSIGGLVLEFGLKEDGSTDWYKIEKLEMVELSVVPVGAHPDALVTGKSIGMKPETLIRQFEDFVQRSMVDKLKDISENELDVHINSLESILAALKQNKTLLEQQDSTAGKKVKLVTLKRLAGEADHEIGNLNKVIKIKLKGS